MKGELHSLSGVNISCITRAWSYLLLFYLGHSFLSLTIKVPRRSDKWVAANILLLKEKKWWECCTQSKQKNKTSILVVSHQGKVSMIRRGTYICLICATGKNISFNNKTNGKLSLIVWLSTSKPGRKQKQKYHSSPKHTEVSVISRSRHSHHNRAS